MQVVIFLGFVAMASAFANTKLTTDGMIDYINSLETTWKAGHNFPKDMTLEHKKRIMSGLLRTPEHMKMTPRPKRVPEGWVAPESFDARDEWPQCKSISEIQDQGNCGSCWCVAAVTSMSDRSCIHSNNTESFQYSIEDLLSCSSGLLVGSCNGGYIPAAWKYWINDGIVSGGPYESNEGCRPYTIAPTGVTQAKLGYTPACKKQCISSYDVEYEKDKRFGQDHAPIPQDEDEIKYEIMTNGPIEVGFTVFADFEVYKKGVYQHKSDLMMGGHAVRMLGWGVEDGTPYWLCANSWNTSWGLDGFFKILRGSNECGIEEEAHSGTPKPLDDQTVIL